MNGKISSDIVFCDSFDEVLDKIKCLYNGTNTHNDMQEKSHINKIKELCKNGIVIEKSEKTESNIPKATNLQNVRICIVSDENVEEKYMDKIKRELNKTDAIIFDFILKTGDASKNMENAIKLYQKLIKYNFSRNDLIIGMGGGVVGDFSGFVSSTYKRGTKLFYIPTTVLSQADSCIGGKTAVNFYQNKNMIGIFYPADVVYINLDTLKSLPNRQYFNGFAEIIKEGYVLDSKLLQFLNENKQQLLERNGKTILKAISWCNRLKYDVMMKDPYDDKGHREILNFGHTLAHAIEAESEYSILHGEAVAIGILYVLLIGVNQGILTQSDFQQGYEMMQSFRLLEHSSQFIHSDVLFEDLMTHMIQDKKNDQHGISFILLRKTGQAYKHTITDRFFLEDMWSKLKEYFV